MATPLQNAILEAMRGVVWRVREEWEMPPIVVSLRIEGDGIGIAAWPVPLSVWDLGRPPDVLENLARTLALKEGGWLEYGSDLCAVAFLCEGWTVPAELADDPQVREYTRRHNLRDHPARIECRMFTAIDRSGSSFFVQWNRGEPEPLHAMMLPPGDEDKLGGAVFFALDLLAEQMLGTTPAGRRLSAGEDGQDVTSHDHGCSAANEA